LLLFMTVISVTHCSNLLVTTSIHFTSSYPFPNSLSSCEVSGLCRGLLGYDAMQCCDRMPTVWRTSMFPSYWRWRCIPPWLSSRLSDYNNTKWEYILRGFSFRHVLFHILLFLMIYNQNFELMFYFSWYSCPTSPQQYWEGESNVNMPVVT
jgi:hypothetical protein